MKLVRKLIGILTILVITFFACGCGGGGSNYYEPPLDDATRIEYVKEAFTFTFPLVYMHYNKVRFTNAMWPTPIAAPINQFSHAEAISDVNYGEAFHANLDIVCSQAFLDLGKDAVVFTKPTPDRFCIFELYDAYTNCIMTMGKGTSSNAQKYLITGPFFTGKVPTGMTQVKVPTNMAWLVGRIRCFGEEDLENVKAIQAQIEAKELDLYQKGKPQPVKTYYDPNEFVPLTKLRSLTSDEYFNLANELMIKNPPKAADAEVVSRMKKVGVGPGLTFNPSILGENGYRYFESMKDQCMYSEWSSNSQQYLFRTSNHDSGKWNFYSENIANFGKEYDYRAFCALNYLCAEPNSTCLVYFTTKDDDGKNLYGNNRYRLRFRKFPPIKENGFWSLTLYDANNHFVTEKDNTVFSINDLTELEANESGYTDVYLQPAASSSASVASGTILTPSNKSFHLLLRIYLPHEAAISGFWSAPILTIAEEESKK